MSHPLSYRLGVLLAPALVPVALWDPASTHILPGCPFRAVTGLDCPLCGSTRALHHLLRGDLRIAAGLNLLLVLALPAIAWLTIRRPKLSAWTIRTVLVAVVAFGVLRNLPWPAVAWMRS